MSVAALASPALPSAVHTRRTISAWMIAACGVWLMGLGLYFAVLRPPLLPEDFRFIGTSEAQLRLAAPGLDAWLKHVFTVMGGFMASAGILTVLVATARPSARVRGRPWALAVSGILTVALMSANNFAIRSDFQWVLLAPALLWAGGATLHAIGR